jgi:CO/xanthine dehydrogenase FAD-binding subunit
MSHIIRARSSHIRCRFHILKPGDLPSASRIPSTWAGGAILFREGAGPECLGFALMTVASAIQVSDNVIERMRLAVNGAAVRPLHDPQRWPVEVPRPGTTRMEAEA